MPGVNPTGTNTAMSTSEVAMMGPVTSRHGEVGGLAGASRSSSSWRETFSTTTMASSTTRPMARTRPNMRERIDGEADHLHERERPDQGHGDGDRGDQGRPPALQEHVDHEDHEAACASSSVITTSLIDSRTNVVVS